MVVVVAGGAEGEEKTTAWDVPHIYTVAFTVSTYHCLSPGIFFNSRHPSKADHTSADAGLPCTTSILTKLEGI